jgi:Putative enzyme of poly-gamma-glutamate biosynthesis (capsule formation)
LDSWRFLSLHIPAFFDDVTNHEGLGCAYINDLRVNHDIIEAKKTVDYLFVLPHDGIEYIDAPLPETIAKYRDFIDYGADGVIGTHPHCTSRMGNIQGKPFFIA